jgi:hypothetical protein
MAITKTTVTAQAPKAEAPAHLVLQLAKHTRLVEVNGPIYENHKAYRFPLDVAQEKLSQIDDITGMPLWKVYRAPVQREVHSTPQAPQIMDASQAKTVNDQPVSAGQVKAIEIGTPEELAELGLSAPDDSSTVEI